MTYRKIDNLEKSIVNYSKAIETDSKHYKSFFNRGFCKEILEDFEGALFDYNRCLKICPGNVKALFHIGNLYEKNPKFKSHLKKARDYFLDALKIDANYAPCYNGLALVYDKMGKKEKALRYFDKALKVDKDNSIYLQNKACCLRRLGKLDKSLKYFKKAIKADPENSSIHSNLG